MLQYSKLHMNEYHRIDHPKEFKQGVRILMLILRSKEGGKVNMPDRGAKKIVSRNEKEFDEALEKLSKMRVLSERIYATVEERDLGKGIRIFKERQLEADYYDADSHSSFYIDIWNRWISSLQSPKASMNTLFLVDIDEGDDEEMIKKEIKENEIKIVHEYNTKNGKHIILYPFNPSIVSFKINKNFMMLWEY